jgi:hypothetical protein
MILRSSRYENSLQVIFRDINNKSADFLPIAGTDI